MLGQAPSEPLPGNGPLVQALPPETPETGAQRFGDMFQTTIHEVCADYANFYTLPTAERFGLVLAVAAPAANTQLDQHFRNWYQDNVRSTTSNHIAAFWKNFGEGEYVIPAAVLVDITGKYFEDSPFMGVLGDFGDRMVRAYAVGGPPLLVMQEMLGSGRPSDTVDNSYWHPFQHDNGASGHAFIGAVPFITAAQMSDNLAEKTFFYACSMMTGWSRINDDAHYLSEVWVGWWLAYLACDSVNNTEQANKNVNIVPIINADMTGVGVLIKR
jgi:hypothetical protein